MTAESGLNLIQRASFPLWLGLNQFIEDGKKDGHSRVKRHWAWGAFLSGLWWRAARVSAGRCEIMLAVAGLQYPNSL